MMPKITTEITSDDTVPLETIARLETLAKQVCRRFAKQAIHLDMAVMNDAEIRRLKQQFFGRDETTDVISFDLTEPGETQRTLCVAINGVEAERQARRRGHDVHSELALYAVHGLLHQFGYDDADPAQAETMHRMEDRILEEEGFEAAYRRLAKRRTQPP